MIDWSDQQDEWSCIVDDFLNGNFEISEQEAPAQKDK